MRTLHEGARGCGYRQAGGIYLVSDGVGIGCPLMPIEMTVCACCGQGIKPARGFTWVDPDQLLPHHLPRVGFADEIEFDGKQHSGCPLNQPGLLDKRAGLLWIGRKFYPTPADWLREGERMGFSRRISQVPRDFVLGETYILVGHRDCIPNGYIDSEGTVYDTLDLAMAGTEGLADQAIRDHYLPGIFHIWKPERIEYVVTGEETEEELAALEKRGIEPVRVVAIRDEIEGV